MHWSDNAPPHPQTERARIAKASTQSIIDLVPGEVLQAVHYVSYRVDDPACIDKYTPPDTHFVEMEVSLGFASGLRIFLSWQNTMSRTGEYELGISRETTLVPPPRHFDSWANRSWESAMPDPNAEDPWCVWDMATHPVWTQLLGLEVSEAGTRWYDEGIWDLMLSFGSHRIYFYCWASDVVFVSSRERPLDDEEKKFVTLAEVASLPAS